MKGTLLTVAAVSVLGIVLTPFPAGALGLAGIGFKTGYLDSDDVDGTLAISGHLEFEHPGSRLHVLPSLYAWSSDPITDINPNLDVYYHFSPEGTVTPYLGAGLGLHFLDVDLPGAGSETDVGGNFFGGVRFPMRSSHLFLEGRYAVSDVSQGSLLGGVTLHLGH
jgi:hypothetical protein